MIVRNISYQLSTPTADWLSISYPTSSSPLTDFISFFGEYTGITEVYSRPMESLYRVGEGSLKIIHKDEFQSFSFSGDVLRSVRSTSGYPEFLRLLASAPYNISRLDIAYDLPVEGSLSINNIKSLYPDSKCTIAGFSRNMQFILSNADTSHGQTTGTAYFQSKKYSGHIFLKVYDKTHEAASRLGLVGHTLNPITRYELTVKRGASLKDLVNPSSCFWHFIPVELLRRPKEYNISSWSPTERVKYDESSSLGITDYAAFKHLVQNHQSLQQLVTKALSVNGGDVILKNELNRLLDSIPCSTS